MVVTVDEKEQRVVVGGKATLVSQGHLLLPASLLNDQA